MRKERLYVSIYFIFAMSFLVFTGSCNENKAYESYKVYYIPFDMHFYGAIEADRIEKTALFAFEMISPDVDELYEAVFSSATDKRKADDILDLRIKMVRPGDGKIVYVDSRKNIISLGQIHTVNRKLVKAVIREVISKARDTECLGEKYICDSLEDDEEQ